MPGTLITEVSPAGRWKEKLWVAGRDERQFWEIQAMPRSYLLCVRTKKDRLWTPTWSSVIWAMKPLTSLSSQLLISIWKETLGYTGAPVFISCASSSDFIICILLLIVVFVGHCLQPPHKTAQLLRNMKTQLCKLQNELSVLNSESSDLSLEMMPMCWSLHHILGWNVSVRLFVLHFKHWLSFLRHALSRWCKQIAFFQDLFSFIVSLFHFLPQWLPVQTM